MVKMPSTRLTTTTRVAGASELCCKTVVSRRRADDAVPMLNYANRIIEKYTQTHRNAHTYELQSSS